MKSVVCVVFLLTIFVTLSFAATARGHFKDPRYPGKCVIKENLILSSGEQIKDPDQDCVLIICLNDSDAEYQSCGTLESADDWIGDYLDVSLPYPDCCKREVINNMLL